jgi:ribosome-binding factor A
MGSHRLKRVGDLIQREISEIIERELKDPRIGMVTITGATVSADLRHARIYFSVYGDEKDQERTRIGLESARYFIQGQIGRRLRLKYTPELSFHFDESLEYGFFIDKILKELREDDDEGHEGGDPGS